MESVEIMSSLMVFTFFIQEVELVDTFSAYLLILIMIFS